MWFYTVFIGKQGKNYCLACFFQVCSTSNIWSPGVQDFTWWVRKNKTRSCVDSSVCLKQTKNVDSLTCPYLDVHCRWTTLGVSWLEPPCVWSSTTACSLPTVYQGLRGTRWWPRRAAWCLNLSTSSWLVKTRSDGAKSISSCPSSASSGDLEHEIWWNT